MIQGSSKKKKKQKFSSFLAFISRPSVNQLFGVFGGTETVVDAEHKGSLSARCIQCLSSLSTGATPFSRS